MTFCTIIGINVKISVLRLPESKEELKEKIGAPDWLLTGEKFTGAPHWPLTGEKFTVAPHWLLI